MTVAKYDHGECMIVIVVLLVTWTVSATVTITTCWVIIMWIFTILCLLLGGVELVLLSLIVEMVWLKWYG